MAIAPSSAVLPIPTLRIAVGRPARSRFAWAGVTVLAAASLILALRRPDALVHPQFYAEDGMFFANAYGRGPAAILLPYNGYLHLVPRLVAALTVGMDPLWLPALYVGAAFTAWLTVAGILLSPRVRLPAKPALILALALVPHDGEVLLCFCNIQWLLVLGLFLTWVSADAATLGERIWDCAFAGLAGLTGPFSVFLLPLFGIRVALRRTRESFLLAIVLALCAGIQATLLYRWRAQFFGPGPADPMGLSSAMTWRTFGTFFLGYGRLPLNFGWISLLIGPGLAALVAGIAAGSRFWRTAQAGMVAAASAVTVAVAFRFLHAPASILPSGNGDRYFFLPHVLLAWLLIVAGLEYRGWRRVAAWAALALALIGNRADLRAPPLRDDAWAQHVRPIREGKAFSIPINPDGWAACAAGRYSRR